MGTNVAEIGQFAILDHWHCYSQKPFLNARCDFNFWWAFYFLFTTFFIKSLIITKEFLHPCPVCSGVAFYRPNEWPNRLHCQALDCGISVCYNCQREHSPSDKCQMTPNSPVYRYGSLYCTSDFLQKLFQFVCISRSQNLSSLWYNIMCLCSYSLS